MIYLIAQLPIPETPEAPLITGEVNNLLMYFIGLLLIVIVALSSVIVYLYLANNKEQKENREIQTDTLDAFKLLADGMKPIGHSVNEVKATTFDTNKVVTVIQSKINR